MFERSATAGFAPDYPIPSTNFTEFLFSDPFYAGSGLADRRKPGLAERVPQDHSLFIDPATEGRLTRGQFESLTLRYAAGFRHRCGLLPTPLNSGSAPLVSPIVLVHLVNSLAFPPLTYGIIAAGLTLTLANTALTPTELAHILRKSRPAAIVTAQPGVIKEALKILGDGELTQRYERFLYTVDQEDIDFGRADIQADDHRVLLRPVNASGSFRFAQMTEAEAKRRVALIIWSSGTSGVSKGVQLSHYALIAGTLNTWHGNLKSRENQVFIGFAPFYHIFGWAQILTYGSSLGATIVIMRKFDPKLFLDYAGRYHITILHMAPPVGVFLAKSPLVDAADLSSFRFTHSGGAPLGVDVINAVHQRTGIMIRMGYGTSEAGSLSTQHGETWEELQHSLGTAGRPLPGVQFRIVSTDGEDKLLKIDEEGEILLKTPGAMVGYLDNPEADASTFTQDGWIRTGDIGLIDKHGNLRITDRLKDLIKVKGFQCVPAELENVLCGSHLIADAGACGIPDLARASEKPRAWVVLTDAGRQLEHTRLVEELRRHTEARLTRYKWLIGNICIVDVIPKSPAGKILRRDLKNIGGVELELYDDDGRAIGVSKL